MQRSTLPRERLLTVARVVLLTLAMLVVAVVAGYVLWTALSAAIGPTETVGPAG
jgi:hypothetical protein